MVRVDATARTATRRWLLRAISCSLAAAGVLMIATARQWGPPAVALFDGSGILPQFATSVPFWPLIPIALGAWFWPSRRG